MSEQALNIAELENLSLEELRQRAEAEARGEAPQVAEKKQGRDEQGRFTKPEEQYEEEVQDDSQEEEQPHKLYRRVVDIGEGNPEIFEAESLEELVDKIADAKAHATRKIREQEAQLKKQREAESQTRHFSEDEEYVFSQELMSNPTKAFSKMFEEMVGMPITEFKSTAERMRALQTAETRNAAIQHFLNTHPDYEDNKRNMEVMTLAMQGRTFSAEALEKAYLDLKAKGLLAVKDAKQNSVQEDEQQDETRIASEPAAKNPTQGTRKSSSLSTKNRNPVPVKSNEPSEDELYSMPLAQLKAEALKRSAGR